MNQQKAITPTGYDVSTKEIHGIITDWAASIEGFRMRHVNLTKLINALQESARRNPHESRKRLRKLIELRQYMSDALMTLMLDLSEQKPARSLQASKPGQLHTHASILAQLSKEIDAELVSGTVVAQA
jgi:hypothetical protein